MIAVVKCTMCVEFGDKGHDGCWWWWWYCWIGLLKCILSGAGCGDIGKCIVVNSGGVVVVVRMGVEDSQ